LAGRAFDDFEVAFLGNTSCLGSGDRMAIELVAAVGRPIGRNVAV